MSNKRIIIFSLAMAFLVYFFIQNGIAAANNWKEEQRKIFDQIPVKPGDLIDQSSWEKVKELLPESIVNWVKKGEFTISIGELKFDLSSDDAWMRSSAKNAGKYTLGAKKELIEVTTGKWPMWIYGEPFPNVDVKNDPDGPIKLMYNQDACMARGGSEYRTRAAMDWVGMGGFERSNVLEWLRYAFWQRPDGEKPNPNKFKFIEMVPCVKPYDTKGIVNMSYRFIDASTDQVFIYLPVMRRVKRLSGAGRSDPTLGGDTTMDDGNGWCGHNPSMKWKFLGEKIVLMPLTEWVAKRPRKLTKQADGAWLSESGEPEQRVGWQERDWKGAPWAMINTVWIPRKMYIVEAKPLDPYYTYGPMKIYVDALTKLCPFKINTNKAGEYWKTVITVNPCCEWGENRSFNSTTFVVGVDDRTHHASCIHGGGIHRGEPEARVRFMDPKVVRSLFTPAKLKIWSK